MALPSTEEAKEIALLFCQGMAQMVTIDRRGQPTGRTLGSRLKPDWSVDVFSYKSFKRIDQVRRKPNVLFIWEEQPASGTKKVIFGKGKADVIDGEGCGQAYEEEMERRGVKSEMNAASAAERLSLVRVRLTELRLEGFAAPGSELLREDVRTGLTVRLT